MELMLCLELPARSKYCRIVPSDLESEFYFFAINSDNTTQLYLVIISTFHCDTSFASCKDSVHPAVKHLNRYGSLLSFDQVIITHLQKSGQSVFGL